MRRYGAKLKSERTEKYELKKKDAERNRNNRKLARQKKDKKAEKQRKKEFVRESKGQKRQKKSISKGLFQRRKQAPVLRMMKHQNEAQLVKQKPLESRKMC